jgi:ribonuclease-3
MRKNFEELEKQIGYIFKRKELLLEALTHRSHNRPYNNERFEFLGDSLLNFVTASYLFKKFPQSNEGALSKLRSSLVSKAGLYKVAKYFNLGEYLLISNAEEKNKGRVKKSLLSNAVESVISAIYIDSNENLSLVEKIIIDTYNAVYPVIDLKVLFSDYKTILQEITQADFGVIPEYRVISTRGPDHEKEFEIAVFINNEEFGSAIGFSKKSAEQSSAKLTIEQLDMKYGSKNSI